MFGIAYSKSILFAMKNLILINLTLLSFTFGCVKQNVNQEIFPEILTDTPQVLAPNFLSTHMAERDASLSPKGNEFYYTITSYTQPVIVFTKKLPKGWTKPEVAPFSGVYSDLEPHFSPDGQRMYFASNRPLTDGGEPKDFDIWYVDRIENEWSKPVNIGSPINTEANEFYPSITNSGTLYWCAIRNDSIGLGGEDIYYSTLENGNYKSVTALPDSVNTTRDEYNAYVARDESYIIFTSSGWGKGYGRGDLWISFKRTDGLWTKAKNIGSNLNSSGFEYCPFVSDCGKHLFYTSDKPANTDFTIPINYENIKDFSLRYGNKASDIYVVDAKIIDDLKKESLRSSK